MKINDVDAERLRRLAETRADGGEVLSLYLDLEPSEFATGAARATAISSLLDEADRQARSREDDHDAARALREDVERVRGFFRSPDFEAKGAAALAVFASGPAELFEVLKLPAAVGNQVVIDREPYIEPLTRAAGRQRLGVVLLDRRRTRIFHGTADALEEIIVQEDNVHGQHQAGGWSQRRYQGGIGEDVITHVKGAFEDLLRAWKARPFDRLLAGAQEPLWAEAEQHLHPYLRERFIGRFDADVETETPDGILERIRPLLEEQERRAERQALDQVLEGVGRGGRGTTGLDDTLGALTERRVQALLYEDGFTAPGVACPQCGYVGTADTCAIGTADSECPREHVDDVVERAVQAAVQQSADVLVVRHHPDLGEHGRIGAVLRF
jgi:peptide subunit release factor 1 (eRF1)